MPLKAFTDLPMTPLEEKFKECLAQRPDIQDHIPSSDELTQYISWLAQNHSHNAIRDMKLPIQLLSPSFSEIAGTLRADPLNTTAISRLASGYGNHVESFFFPADRDITISRQLRYLPSHWHSNGYFEIYYAVSGSCSVHFPEEIVPLRPGSIMVVAPNAVHACPCYQDDCVLLFYMIRISTFQQVFWNQIPSDSLMATFFRQVLDGTNPTSYLHFETNDDPDIQRVLLQIYAEEINGGPYQSQLMNALMSTFFILLLRRYESSVQLPRTKDFFWKHEYSAILSFIQTNYATVTLQELSGKFHYSPRQISRIVQSSMGISYNQLILKLRMEKAAALLSQKNLSIESIAQAVGYTTISSFYRAFTNYYGCTPREYTAH